MSKIELPRIRFHQDVELFREAVRFTTAETGFAPRLIKKDYFCTLFLVRQQDGADPGKIIVALVDGEATIKKLVKGPGYYLLNPESTNPKPRPIIVTQDFRIQGTVCREFKKGGELLHGVTH